MGRKKEPAVTKKSKNQLRRERAKLAKAGCGGKKSVGVQSVVVSETAHLTTNNEHKSTADSAPNTVENPEKLLPDDSMVLESMYKGVFDKFDASKMEVDEDSDDKQELAKGDIIDNEEDGGASSSEMAANAVTSTHENEEQQIQADNTPETDNENQNLSKRQFKKIYSIPLSVLKSESTRPEVVEWMDSNAPDPRMYVYLKSLRNSVPVPVHWKSKKGFLSSKRGIERPPFELPKFIRDTGILEMRDIVAEAESQDQSTLKDRMRQRVQPKTGQLDIDYDKMYDAFFKYQKKPPLLKFGELYTENTNNDDLALNDKIARLKVGVLSSSLKFALGMTNESGKVINRLPPWYAKMKQIGPPPSYPDMKINERGVITVTNDKDVNIGPPIITSHWGTLVNDLDVSDEEEEDEEEDSEGKRNTEKKSDNNTFDQNRGDVLLTAFGADPTLNTLREPTKTESSGSKSLYKVIETGSNSTNSIFGSNAGSYNVSR